MQIPETSQSKIFKRILSVCTLFGALPPAALAESTFDPVAATEAYMAKMSPETIARSNAYFEGGYWLDLASVILTVAVCWLLMRTGFARAIRAKVESLVKRRFLRRYLAAVLFVIVFWLLAMPFDIYREFWREHQFGLSNLSFGGWFGEHVIGLLVTLILFPPVIAGLYSLIRKRPSGWWKVAALITLPLMLFFILLAPVFIAPLFNNYKPITDPKVRDPILALARANGVPAENVYEFDASKQTNRVSANVSGALGTIRISLNDNLLNRCPPEGVMAVMAHELGHYVLDHVYKHIVYFTLLFAAVFWFADTVLNRAVAKKGKAWGIGEPGDIATLPILAAAMTVALYITSPVQNTIIRTDEVEADIFGLNAAREPDAFADVILMLSDYRKMRPGPVEEFLLFDHPAGYHRILTAMRWKAEHLPEGALDSAAPATDPAH